MHPSRRTLAPQRLRHAIEIATHIGVVGMEARVSHRHGDGRVAELLRELGKRHPCAGEVHGRRVAVVVQRIAYDPREPTGAVVFVLRLPAVRVAGRRKGG